MAQGAPLWTYMCQFRKSPDDSVSYESIVRAAQAALNIKYQPDETADNVNQVYFSDPARPLWRLNVTRLADPTGDVLFWIAPQQPAGGVSATPFNSGAPLSDATVRGEIEKVRGGKYTRLPPIQATSAGASRNGMAAFEIRK